MASNTTSSSSTSGPSPSRIAKFDILLRLATSSTHDYVYKWSEEKDGVSAILFDTDPVTGEEVMVVKLLRKFTRWLEAGWLHLVDTATEDAIAEIDTYLEEINERLILDLAFYEDAYRKITDENVDLRPEPIKEGEEDEEEENSDGYIRDLRLFW